jgi:hypothetical protein
MDKYGEVYFWDLLTTKPKKQMKCRYDSAVTNVVEIAALNLLAIVQESKRLTE